MKKYLLVLIFFFCVPLFSQVETEISKSSDFPKFYFDLLNFFTFSEKQSRLDVFVQVPYRNLQFIKSDDSFISQYEITISIYDSEKNPVTEKTFSRELKLTNFEETVSKQNYDLSQKSINLKPGNYLVEISLTDNDSKKTFKTKKSFEIRDFEKNKICLSDIMLISKLNEVEGKRKIIPNVSGNVGNLPDKFHIFFEIYSKDKISDSINISYTITNKKNKSVFDTNFNYYMSGAITQVFFDIKNKDYIFGDYKLVIKLNAISQGKVIELAAAGRYFMVRWQDMPISVNDLNLAILQMQFIATTEEIDTILAAKDEKERQIRFLKFWKDRRPSMEEYFARVDYANEHFKTHKDGWRTDMGMVYIIFGPPDNVDRHPFDMGSVPYEVWDYFNINRRFIFVDESGFGEYRLLNPIWDKDVRIN
jgi:GWxTD domain-containing protein